MNWEELAKELSQVNPAKIVLLVIDGLGGLPVDGQTELERANHPNLNQLAWHGSCGLTDPVFPGITPGSGPAHLALFGYDPLKYQLGRGILEALGVGLEVGPNDLVARGNFATLKNGLIVDRRAGRIATEINQTLCQKIQEKIKIIDGVEITLVAGREHRFVVRFRGENLHEALSDADPQKEGQPQVEAKPLTPEAERSASIVNNFIYQVTVFLKDEPVANTILLRGFSKLPAIPSMSELYKIRPLALANYPMYKGLAKLLGMEVESVGPSAEDLATSLEKNFMFFDFFYLHFKKTDSAGEDGKVDKKVAAIEEIDAIIPRLLALKPDVLCVTSDHSTPALLKAHSWHPNPLIILSSSLPADNLPAFTERNCAQGSLGRLPAKAVMPLLLAAAGKLKKYGA
ncbi:MAG: 2,3-bisphosphoglycerate-independent phosphoglycerate mutase [Candidatus Aminicenantes bacterium]|nr:2,3-bisphosphoglycerate-independent phosphoglycerate mutase [Candidatus Aminicenantes bacterium]